MLKAPVTPADHIRGRADAPVTLVEYGDYECGFCAAAHPNVVLVQQRFRNELSFVFRHFPLTQIHPTAETAAETAEFAGARGLFWEMHEGIYENHDRFGLPLLFSLATALGLSETALRDALAIRQFAGKVRDDFLGGVRSGVNATPTFFINGQRHDGSYAFEELAAAIDLRLHAAV